MMTMEDSMRRQHITRRPLMIALLIANGGVCAFVVASCLSWWAVTFMIIPYPELMAQAGQSYAMTFKNTAVFTALSPVAGGALWLLWRRHAWRWFAQAGLWLAVIATLSWALGLF